VGYLIEELHTSFCWPILVYSVSCKMNGNIYTEIRQHGIYIIMISRPCKDWEKDISRFSQELYQLSVCDNALCSLNSKGKFIVSVMSNCTDIENTKFKEFFAMNFGLKDL
jgi:hypothetical protein